jgi:formate/nitrite transporter FocA (FNT family)
MLNPLPTTEKAISALSGTPMLLALVLLNLLGLVMVSYLITASAQYRFKERSEMIELLRECTKQDARKGLWQPHQRPFWFPGVVVALDP